MKYELTIDEIKCEGCINRIKNRQLYGYTQNYS